MGLSLSNKVIPVEVIFNIVPPNMPTYMNFICLPCPELRTSTAEFPHTSESNSTKNTEERMTVCHGPIILCYAHRHDLSWFLPYAKEVTNQTSPLYLGLYQRNSVMHRYFRHKTARETLHTSSASRLSQLSEHR